MCAVPSGAKLIHGSLARSKLFAPLAPVHRLKPGAADLHVAPRSNETAPRIALAPPLDHRSCCQAAIRCVSSFGSTARCGSTSESTNSVPPPARLQPGESAALPETGVSPANDCE